MPSETPRPLRHIDILPRQAAQTAPEPDAPVTYKLDVYCNNCKFRGSADILKGVTIGSALCTNCGCAALVHLDQVDGSPEVAQPPRAGRPSGRGAAWSFRELQRALDEQARMQSQGADARAREQPQDLLSYLQASAQSQPMIEENHRDEDQRMSDSQAATELSNDAGPGTPTSWASAISAMRRPPNDYARPLPSPDKLDL